MIHVLKKSISSILFMKKFCDFTDAIVNYSFLLQEYIKYQMFSS